METRTYEHVDGTKYTQYFGYTKILYLVFTICAILISITIVYTLNTFYYLCAVALFSFVFGLTFLKGIVIMDKEADVFLNPIVVMVYELSLIYIIVKFVIPLILGLK